MNKETLLRRRWRAELNGCEFLEATKPNITMAVTCAWLNCIHNGGPNSKKKEAQYWEGRAHGLLEALQMLGMTDEELKETAEMVDRAVDFHMKREWGDEK